MNAIESGMDAGTLQERLDEAEETLEAIRGGRVDAVIVHGQHGPQVFSLEGPDQPFRALVEAIQEGTITLAPDGTMLYANAFFASLVGRPASEVMGANFFEFVVPEYRYTCQALLERGLNDPTRGNCQLRGASAAIPVQITLSPLHGGTAACSGIVFDLRERLLAEKSHAEREAAQQANATKDRFLAVLSHELRSPLNTILGWSQILSARMDLEEDVRSAVAVIERNARAQARLINELLDISRIISKKLHLELEVIDFRPIVEAVAAAARVELGGRSLRIDCRVAPREVYVCGDATRLQQVVTNLVHNAVKFTPDGGSVEVSLGVRANEAELVVTDTGSGIDPAHVSRIFDIFHQENSGAGGTRRAGGLGLGLSIAKQLVEVHEGSIAAESAGLGFGATFTVRLPLAQAPIQTPRPDFAWKEDLKSLRLLVVDDEPDVLELARHLLNGCGADVITAAGAGEALRKLEQGPSFDVLISDIGLPDQDGLALMREVRARGFSPERLPAIALTGLGSTNDVRLAAAAGYQVHLAKPVDTHEFILAIRGVVRTPRA
jgi:PAS domain S-box-containing protein